MQQQLQSEPVQPHTAAVAVDLQPEVQYQNETETRPTDILDSTGLNECSRNEIGGGVQDHLPRLQLQLGRSMVDEAE